MTDFIDADLIKSDDRHRSWVAKQFLADHFGIDPFPVENASTGKLGDRPVRLYTCAWAVSNGSRWTHGKFHVNHTDVYEMADLGGFFAFLVYEKHPDGLVPLFATLKEPGDVPQRTDAPWPEIFPDTGAEL